MEYRSPLEGYYEDGDPRNDYGYGNTPHSAHPYGRSNQLYQRRPHHGPRSEYYGASSSSHNQPSYSDRYKPPSYPRELTDLFGALECRLCGVEVPSPIVAKMHYSGKQHLKKIKKFLLEWSLRTGCEIPELDEPVHSQASVSTFADYCEICDIKLTTVNDKLLHYAGKYHRKNEQDPANAKRRKKTYETIDPTNRFGIGSDFSSGMSEGDTKLKTSDDIEFQEFVCELCDVKAVSHEQLQVHISGKKHKDRLEKKGSAVPKPDKPFVCKTCDVAVETYGLWRLHVEGKRHAKALLKIEMDGADFCDVCNISFTSFDHFQTHIQGKRHVKRCMETYKTTIQVPDEKFTIACKFCPYVGNTDKHKCDKSLIKTEPDLEKKWVCVPCHNMVFDCEEKLNEHKTSRRHLICVFNQEDGDKIVEELKHWYCFICKKQYRNHKDYTLHLFEDRHMTLSNVQSNLEGKTDLFQCSVCSVVMDNEAKDEHLKDKKHLRLSLKKDTMDALTKLANENIESTNFHCSNCNVNLNSFVKYSEHLLSEPHVDRMIREKLGQFDISS